MRRASPVSGLAVPSLKPIRLRGVPEGRGGDTKPSMRQRTCISPRVCRATSRRACATVSGWSAQSWSIRSPWHQASSGSSSGKTSIGRSLRGRREARPKRSSKSEAPTATVAVSPSAGTTGPSTPESGSGAEMPSGSGTPPAVRNRRRSVRVRSRVVSSARSRAVTSKEVNTAWRWRGVRMPAWWAPWKAIVCPSGRADTGSSSARATAPTPPAPTAAPAAPATRARWRKDRRRTPDGAVPAGSASPWGGVRVGSVVMRSSVRRR